MTDTRRPPGRRTGRGKRRPLLRREHRGRRRQGPAPFPPATRRRRSRPRRPGSDWRSPSETSVRPTASSVKNHAIPARWSRLRPTRRTHHCAERKVPEVQRSRAHDQCAGPSSGGQQGGERELDGSGEDHERRRHRGRRADPRSHQASIDDAEHGDRGRGRQGCKNYPSHVVQSRVRSGQRTRVRPSPYPGRLRTGTPN